MALALVIWWSIHLGGGSPSLAQSSLPSVSGTEVDSFSLTVPEATVAPVLNIVSATSFVGSLSCDSASCHGNPRRETVNSSAAHFFLDQDKHQFGGRVLREKRSQQIVTKLGLKTAAWETRECLVCHAPAGVDAANRQQLHTAVSEGVSCESCHGPARNWIDLHQSLDWKNETIWPRQRKESLGFRETKHLLTRAGRCADCHVGNAEQSVTHDFIAAGHPRLAFEYSAYQALMPTHWSRLDDRQRSPAADAAPSIAQSTYEGRSWLVGQLVNAEHELDVLTAAAKDSRRQWPELAQYDCFGCHHELSSPGWRRARTAWNLRPGEFQWGTWNLGVIAETNPSLSALVGQEFLEDQNALVNQLRSLSADRAATAQLGDSLRVRIIAASTIAADRRWTADELSLSRDALLRHSELLTNQGWDRSVQLLLAVIALDKGSRDARGLGNSVEPMSEASLSQLGKLLSYAGAKTPSRSIDPAESPFLLDTNWPLIRDEFQKLESLRGIRTTLLSNRPAFDTMIPALPTPPLGNGP